MKKLQFAVLGLTVGFALACGGMDLDTGSVYIPPPTPAGSATCPPGAITDSEVAGGTSLTLVALHPDDAYFGGDTMGKIPLAGTVPSSGTLSNTEDCWFSGEFEGKSGSDSFYFYKAAFTR